MFRNKNLGRPSRTDRKLADGLWKVCFICSKGKPRTWFVFAEDTRGKPIGELNRLPRIGKGKNLRQAFALLGIGYIPKTKRIRKKILQKA